MIDEKRAEQAIHNLASTDEPYAAAKAQVKGLEHRLKIIKAQAFLEAQGTVAEREARAQTDRAFVKMVDEYQNAVLEMETLGAKRKREELILEFWRSVNANRRVGG